MSPDRLPRVPRFLDTLPRVKHQLSPRQREALALLADGLTDKEIARAMGIGAGTVKDHLHEVFLVLDVDTRVAAMRRGIEWGYVEPITRAVGTGDE
jgi:DNA-binding NarL/FixJ family response regulator